MVKNNIKFYSDEINDDFGNINHKKRDCYAKGSKYKFIRKGFYKYWSNFIAIGIVTPVISIIGWFMGYKFKGYENLIDLKAKKCGYFIYANHASIFDVCATLVLSFPKRVNFTGYSDALDVTIARPFLRILGYIPLPTNPRNLLDFQKVLEYYSTKEKEIVAIYPEAHIWPTYTGVRNFNRTSFRYPSKFNLPVVPVFFARRPRVGIWKYIKKTPCVTTYIGKPIYPDETKNQKENMLFLGDKSYNYMKDISIKVPQEIYYQYVYCLEEDNPLKRKRK